MKKSIIAIVYVVIGCMIGICMPLRPTALGGEIPLFSSWSTLADWTLRILEAVGAIGAVIIALFKDELLWLLKHPELTTDTDAVDFLSDDDASGQNVVSSRYFKPIRVMNTGKATAKNCRVIIDSIVYGAADELVKNELLSSPQDVRWQNSGNQKEDIAVACNRVFELFQILPERHEDKLKKIPSVPTKLFIGGFEIKPEHNGGEYIVTLKIESENSDPKVFKIKITWTGAWRNQKTEMGKLLVVSEFKQPMNSDRSMVCQQFGAIRCVDGGGARW